LLPCAVHIDGTARPQFVSESDNPAYYRFLSALKEQTGFGVCINTSFNMHGRTIVRTVTDAITDMLDCGLDFLYVNGFKVCRKSQ
jgi:carbamoyltransferase